MKFSALLSSFLVMLSACKSTPSVKPALPDDPGRIIKVPANPAQSFNFPYYLYVPSQLEKNPVLYVEPNNTGTQSDDFGVHEAAAKKFIESSYSRRIAQRLQSPMLVPVYPRTMKNWRDYIHYLNRNTIMIAAGPEKRVDLQLKAMIEDARAQLQKEGITIAPKVFMNGFSASAGFTLRFTALHPEVVQATAAGGLNALPIIPLKSWKGMLLPFPIGVGDLFEFTGKEFNAADFTKIPQMLYMGALDENDTVPFEDAWDKKEARFIRHFLGAKMQPDRWEKVQAIYKTSGAPVTFKTYAGVGHKVNDEIENDIYHFLNSHRP